MSNDIQADLFSANTYPSESRGLHILQRVIALRDNDPRMEDILADFPRGFAHGWDMAVGTCFRDALDLKLTDKMSGGRKSQIWTQGGTFSFSQGDTLYDTPKAYERWDQALQSIGKSYHVLSSIPSRPEKQIVYYKRNTSFSGNLKGKRAKANVERRKKVVDAISIDWTEAEEINQAVNTATKSGVSPDLLQELCDIGALERKIETVEPRFPGNIRIQIMKPNGDKSKLVTIEEKSLSQDDFVALLISGSTLKG